MPQIINGFEKIGFSLGIGANEEIKAGMKSESGIPVIPEILEMQAF